MTDRYKKIRKALEMGPTPGPWLFCPTNSGTFVKSTRLAGYFVEVRHCRATQSVDADAHLIAACDPDTIRELLAERDALARDAARYRWLRKGANDDIAVVRGLGAMDYGMSAVVATYSEEIDGDDLDAAIDEAMEKENSDARPLRENPQ